MGTSLDGEMGHFPRMPGADGQAVWPSMDATLGFGFAAQAAGHGVMLPSVSSGLDVPPAATLSTWV